MTSSPNYPTAFSEWAPLTAPPRDKLLSNKMKRFSQRVVGLSPRETLCSHADILLKLSRGKDSSKSSKKNKDSKDGTASPSSRDSSNQSPVLTPSSSTSTLNDIRNKPLPPNNAGGSDHSGASQPSNLSNVSQPGVTPDRFGAVGGASSPNGSSASARLPPTVIISPTPGVFHTIS